MAPVPQANPPNLSHSSIASLLSGLNLFFIVLVTVAIVLRTYVKLSVIKSWVLEDCVSRPIDKFRDYDFIR